MLFEPVKIGKMECKNRIAMAPIAIGVGYVNPDGSLTQRAIDYYAERAKGGAGLIIVGATRVEREIEAPSANTPVVSPLSLPSFSELADAVHYFDTKIFIQLTAGLGRALPGELIDAGVKPVSASEVPCAWRPAKSTRSLTQDEIAKYIEAFGRAAKILVTAGIDGIEIHGHAGYLFDQFMTPTWNKRTDKYGGDLEGRMRFPVEVFGRVKKEAGKDFPVTIRLSIKHYMKGPGSGALKGETFKEAGRDTEEGLEIARYLEKAGFDALHIDAGSWESRYWVNVPLYHPHGCMIDLAEKVKKVVSIPVIGVGRINTPELAEQYLQEGKADIIAIGRPLLTDAYWAQKARSGKSEDIRPCIGCHDGCRFRLAQGKPISCSVNPAVGKERLYELKPAEAPKRIMVIGGGVAGMEFARVAALRKHEVLLYEKGRELGGHLIEASVPEFKLDLKALLGWYKIQLSRSSVAVKLQSEITPELIRKTKPDAVIIATGSRALIPDIPGIKKSIVVTAPELLLGKVKTGNQVVVIGGGLVGCETALWLSQLGKKVRVIEMLPAAAQDAFYANRIMLLDLLSLNRVEIMTNTSLAEVGDGEITIVQKDFRISKVPCDTVVLAVGMKANRELYDSIRSDTSAVRELYVLGDSKEPRKIQDAIWDGFNVASVV